MLDRTTQAPDTLGLPVITGWMATEDPATRYDYTDDEDCPCARMLKARGFHDVEVIPGRATFAGGEMKIPPEVDFVLCGMPRTYSAALDRARALVRT